MQTKILTLCSEAYIAFSYSGSASLQQKYSSDEKQHKWIYWGSQPNWVWFGCMSSINVFITDYLNVNQKSKTLYQIRFLE